MKNAIICYSILTIISSFDVQQNRIKWLAILDEEIKVRSDDPDVIAKRNQLGESIKTAYDPGTKATFFQYTRSNTAQTNSFSIKTLQKFKRNDFDATVPTKVIIHGWFDGVNKTLFQNMKDKYLESNNLNVIMVDWSEAASSIFYFPSALATRDVGAEVAEMVDFLVTAIGANYDDIHLVGFSLGAHVAGFAGNMTAQQVSRITGLDPALPSFEGGDFFGPGAYLNSACAKYVDIIHTSSGFLGITKPIGHADFYPNGGPPQPGCFLDLECSHQRAAYYFTESIQTVTPFLAVSCGSYQEFQQNKCENTKVEMGENVLSNTCGQFYLRTSSESLFSLGVNGTRPET